MSEATNNTSFSAPSARRLAPTVWLWASAFVLAGLLIVQIGRLGGSGSGEGTGIPLFTPTAKADLISKVADQTMLTFNAGNDDVLVILDTRAEQMLTYRIKNQTAVELINVYSLPELFATGQRIGIGTGRGNR